MYNYVLEYRLRIYERYMTMTHNDIQWMHFDNRSLHNAMCDYSFNRYLVKWRKIGVVECAATWSILACANFL